jgi:hypothetical protein
MPVIRTGILLAVLSGICNGIFTASMKIIPHWRWGNIWEKAGVSPEFRAQYA